MAYHTNQPPNWPINQAANQSPGQPLNQPIDKQTRKLSRSWKGGALSGETSDQPINQPVHASSAFVFIARGTAWQDPIPPVLAMYISLVSSFVTIAGHLLVVALLRGRTVTVIIAALRNRRRNACCADVARVFLVGEHRA